MGVTRVIKFLIKPNQTGILMKTIIIIILFLSCCSPAQMPAGPLVITPEARDLIVGFETGGQSYYTARLKSPSYPGGASGTTIGIGYDCGYNTRAQILADWAALPKGSRDALAATAGVKGVAAKSRAAACRWIVVPWALAQDVFVARTMPRFGVMTAAAFPGILSTHGHVQGVVLSLVFNRGPAMQGSSRAEMRSVRAAVAAGTIRPVPAHIRAMKRLWLGKGLPGLLLRREAEAALVERVMGH
jgi:hypothetical protein